jgi:hypothetical protein
VRNWRVAATALLVVASGCSADQATPNAPVTTALTHTITGTLILKDELNAFSGAPCTGQGGYGDIREGAQITVKDETNTLLAVGHLEPGITYEVRRTQFTAYSYCHFSFAITSVPDRPFYQVEASHRGAWSYQRDDLHSRAWRVDVSIG